MRQRHEGKNSPFTLIIGPHHHPEVFDRDHEEEGPNQQGQNAQDRGGCGGQPNGWAEALAQRIEGTRANIAIYNPQSREDKQALLLVVTRFSHRNAYTRTAELTQSRKDTVGSPVRTLDRTFKTTFSLSPPP